MPAITSGCRVHLEELKHDKDTYMSDEAEMDREEEITKRVDYIMSGDNPDLVMEVVANDDGIEKAVMELCLIQIKPEDGVNNIDFMKAKQLAMAAMKINKLIAEELRPYVENEL